MCGRLLCIVLMSVVCVHMCVCVCVCVCVCMCVYVCSAIFYLYTFSTTISKAFMSNNTSP